MTFKEYFLLRESPDTAAFVLPGEINTTWASYNSENLRPYSLIVTKTCIMWIPSADHYHYHMIKDLGKWAIGESPDFPFPILGTVSNDFKVKLRVMTKERNYDRLDLVKADPYILMARSWIIGDATMGISFWNKSEHITSGHKALLKKYTRLMKCDSHLTLYEVEGDQLTAFQFANMNAKTANPNYEVSGAVHLLPSDKKRAALKLRGAVPKAPIPLDQKMRREGD